MMRGPEIIARSLSVATRGGAGKAAFQHGNSWQYHSRSDRHSKIACWALMFDLMRASERLRLHLGAGKVAVGINHEMRDFAHNRAKNLDLVICGLQGPPAGRRFADLVGAYTIQLDDDDSRELALLPDAPLAKPSTVLMALEAKACMTEFVKARPRLYDELNSSHLTIHGDTDGAIAAGFLLLNVAPTFVSPIRNPWTLGDIPTRVSTHNQPRDARLVAEKIAELPRRARPGDEGFDAFAILAIDLANDGRPVTLAQDAPGRVIPTIFDYDAAVERLAHLYATRFSGI